MKRFFQRVWATLSAIFGGFKKLEAFLTDHIDDAIEIAGKIKEIIESPTTIFLIKILPAKYRDNIEKVLQKIEPILDKTISILNVGGDCLQKPTTVDKLTCFIEQVRKMSPKMQEATIREFVQVYTQQSSGNKYPDHVIDTAVQNRFFDLKQQNKI